MLREWYIITKNIGECLVAAFALERSGSEEHFIDQYAKRPPVDCAGMTTTLDDFWCNVFFCTDERVGSEVCYAGFGVDCG